MKYSSITKFRRPLAIVLLLILTFSLAGCWGKNDDASASSTPSTEPSIPVITLPPPETTQAPSTEAPTETPTEAPTEEVPTEPEQDTVMATVDVTKLNIRKGPGSDYQSIGSYFEDERIKILEIKGDWGRTDKGWVCLDYVQLDGDTGNKNNNDNKTETTNKDIVSDGKTTALGHGVVTLGSLNVRTGPGTGYEAVGTVSLGNRYAYYQKSGNWVRIKDGWVSANYLYIEGNTGDGAGIGTTTADLNIRTGPGTGYDKAGALKQGETVKILAQVNSWGYTAKGWVSMNYVKMDGADTAYKTGKGTVTATTLNIRKEASTTSEAVGSYKKDDKVEILEVKGDWGRTDKGWISLEYVKMDASTTTTTTTTYKTGKGTVTASELNIRKDASTTSESVGSYKKGDKVEILEVKGAWGRTDKGWISLEYVKMDASTTTTTTTTYKTGKGTVTATSLYIRKSADKSSETVGAYFKDDTVEILEVKGEWGRTNKGWINLKYVKMS